MTDRVPPEFTSLTTPTATAIYTLSLHDALPISLRQEAKVQPSTSERTRSGLRSASSCAIIPPIEMPNTCALWTPADRKSTRLNSSHLGISYAVFCLKKKIKEFTQ